MALRGAGVLRNAGLAVNLGLVKPRETALLEVKASLDLSLKAETTLVLAETITLDLTGEYLPLIYSVEEAEVVSTQFDGDVSPQTVKSFTNGFQAIAALRYDAGTAGRFLLRGKVFLDTGERSASSLVVDGNYSYESVDTADSRQRDLWLELIHSMTYLKEWVGLTPALALALQQRAVAIDDAERDETTYKVGLLMEFD